MFQQHAFCFYYRISVSTFCTVFFAPYRRFAYILPKCFAYISPEHFLLFVEKSVFQQTRFLFLISHIRQHFCTAFFAPYRRFAYILPKCFACISSKHFLLFIEKGVFQQTRFLFLLSHIRQHLYRIFCTVQEFCVHFAQIYIVFP